MTIAYFFANDPVVFWRVVYVAWGGAYGAVTVSLMALYVVGKRKLRDTAAARMRFALLQLLWAITQLATVFGFPLVVGALSTDVLVHGGYDVWWIGSWLVTVVTARLIVGDRFRMSDMS